MATHMCYTKIYFGPKILKKKKTILVSGWEMKKTRWKITLKKESILLLWFSITKIGVNTFHSTSS